MRLPFPSLRANLIAAFVAVIAVSLLLASGTFAYLLREYQVQREYDRLESVAEIYMMQVVRMVRTGASLQVISAQLDQSAGDAGVRVLLLDDRGGVLHDTDNNRYTGTLPGRRPAYRRGVARADAHQRLDRHPAAPVDGGAERATYLHSHRLVAGLDHYAADGADHPSIRGDGAREPRSAADLA